MSREDIIKINKSKMMDTIIYYSIFIQFITRLTSNTVISNEIDGDYFKESFQINELIRNDLRLLLFAYYECKLIFCYLSNNFLTGIKNADLGTKLLSSAFGQVLVPQFYFYHALVIFALINFEQQYKYFKKIKRYLLYFNKLAKAGPANYLHKYLLLQAESRWGKSVDTEVIKLYDESIAEAHKQGFTQNEAIANECAAKYFMAL